MIYRLTRRAEADIKSIERYTVKEFGYVQADLYLGGLDALFDLLCENPNLGREIAPGRRRFAYRQHIILYRVEVEELQIIRIWNMKRRLPEGWT